MLIIVGITDGTPTWTRPDITWAFRESNDEILIQNTVTGDFLFADKKEDGGIVIESAEESTKFKRGNIDAEGYFTIVLSSDEKLVLTATSAQQLTLKSKF